MKHRERVLMALSHEIPDRCPMQISFTPEFASLLTKEMKIGDNKLHNPHGGGNTYELERALGEDLLLTSVGWANSYYQDAESYTSDGFIYPIIPDLIEIGLDVLNPIQPASMDTVRLKQDFGDKLCFWGSIDEQHTLPFGSATDVQTEVQTRLKTLGKNGGLILGPTHHVQLDTPLENFFAMANSITQTPYPKP